MHVIGEKPDWVNFVHFSINDLGDEFTFTPRIPKDPYLDIDQNPIEDTITKRTSWAPSVNDALKAVVNKNVNMDIYGVESLPGEVDCEEEFHKNEDELAYKKRSGKVPYGTGWVANDYRMHAFRDPIPLEYVKKDLEDCVPDAPITHEFWATEPVTARKVGTYDRRGMVTWFDEDELTEVRRFVRTVLVTLR